MTPSPIFIFGNRRSGTTLLRLMLTSHPDIVIPPEGDFLVYLGWKYDSKKLGPDALESFLSDLFKMENIADWELDRKSLTERILHSRPNCYPELINEIYMEYCLMKFGTEKKRWGDKTTWYNQYIHQIRRYFPEMKAIHLVRDVRAVVSSYLNVPHLTDNVPQAAGDWMWNNQLIERAKKQSPSGQWVQIRYEELVEEPEDVLREICRFLDEPYHDDMLSYWEFNHQKRLEPERHLGWKEKTLEKVTTSSLEKWKDELNQSQLDQILRVAAKGLKRYSYPVPDQKLNKLDSWFQSVKSCFSYISKNILKSLREMKYRVISLIRI